MDPRNPFPSNRFYIISTGLVISAIVIAYALQVGVIP